jgi:hypothetical protein
MRFAILLLLTAATALTQTLSVSVDKLFIDAGDTVTVTAAYSGSADQHIAGLQWDLADGPWTTAVAGKELHCQDARCILIGMNADEIPSGVIATATFTLTADRSFEISAPVAATPAGESTAITVGAVVRVALYSPHDLTRDGVVDLADVLMGIERVFEGEMTVVDVQQIVNARTSLGDLSAGWGSIADIVTDEATLSAIEIEGTSVQD